MFNWVLQCGAAAGYMFLKDAFFKPKRAIDLFLEGHVGDPMAEATASAAYPGGAKALRRDCKIFTGMSVGKWLTKRRMELARIWIRHGDKAPDEIASALGYRTRSRFRDDYWKTYTRDYSTEFRRDDLRSMDHEQFVRLATPFWYVSEEKITTWFHEGAMEDSRRQMYPEDFMRSRRKKMPPDAKFGDAKWFFAGRTTAPDKIPAPANPILSVVEKPAADQGIAPSLEKFAELKTTGAEIIHFPAESLRPVAGTEDQKGSLDWGIFAA
jgi:AraC-like DNA-binding protein